MWCFKPDNPYIYWKRMTATNCWPICDLSDHQISVLCNFSAPFPCIFLSRYIRKCPQSMSNIWTGPYTCFLFGLSPPHCRCLQQHLSRCTRAHAMPCHRRHTTSQLGICQPAFFQLNKSDGCKQPMPGSRELKLFSGIIEVASERPGFPLSNNKIYHMVGVY